MELARRAFEPVKAQNAQILARVREEIALARAAAMALVASGKLG